MKRLRVDDILDIDSYERVRGDYRARVLAHKKDRRVSVGPQVTLVFEDRETLRYQIQEMARVERTTRPDKIQIEVDVYNELVPGPNELSATLFIEIPDLKEIRPALDRLIGIDEHVAILVGSSQGEESGEKSGEQRVPALFDDRQMEEDRISAVHYLRFTLTPDQASAFREGPAPRLCIDHSSYSHEVELSDATRKSLAADLAGHTPVLLDPESLRQSRTGTWDVLLETATVRALRLSPAGARAHIVVEPVDAGLSLEKADPALLAELFAVAQQIARDVGGRAGGARVRLDLSAQETGVLRFEITAAG